MSPPTSSCSSPATMTPGAPDLSKDTSGPFEFESFYDADIDSTFSETSFNSSLLLPTPTADTPSSSQRVARTYTPGSGNSGIVGLGFIGLFKRDGTPFQSYKVIADDGEDADEEEEYEELPWFDDDYSPGLSPFAFDTSIDESFALDEDPSPRRLDRIFSSLAITKPNFNAYKPLASRPEEPDQDDVFIQRGSSLKVVGKGKESGGRG